MAMTKKQFRMKLLHLDLTQKGFAEIFGVTEETISRNIQGASIPAVYEMVIGYLCAKKEGFEFS